jgi:hypothetical protein
MTNSRNMGYEMWNSLLLYAIPLGGIFRFSDASWSHDTSVETSKVG